MRGFSAVPPPPSRPSNAFVVFTFAIKHQILVWEGFCSPGVAPEQSPSAEIDALEKSACTLKESRVSEEH